VRKIEKAMLDAMTRGQDFSRDNTTVYWYTDADDERYCEVRLHGNRIAEYRPSLSEVYVTDAGWKTATTKSRLNAILDTLVGIRLYQHDFEWFFNIEAVRHHWSGNQYFSTKQ
jgi:hypothetical protein